MKLINVILVLNCAILGYPVEFDDIKNDDTLLRMYYYSFCNEPDLIIDNPVNFFYCNNGIDEQIEIYGNNGSIINPELDTKIIIHGYTQSANSTWVTDMTKEYLSSESDFNIILVDWSSYSNMKYNDSAYYTRVVGEKLCNLIISLCKNGYDIKKIHVIGFSLGAHVAGFAGKCIRIKLYTYLARISGLDPAGPCFHIDLRTLAPAIGRLSCKDANMVDVIHTDAGYIGIAASKTIPKIGTCDFYPNNGFRPQPGCNDTIDRTILLMQEALNGGVSENGQFICSHRKSVELFTESINNMNMIGSKLNNPLETAILGEHLEKNAKGRYYLTTV